MRRSRFASKADPMSRTAILSVGLIVLIGAGFAGLVVLANSSEPPQRQVEQTIPDDKLPK